MKRIKLVVAYDGTNYCGWQLQPNGITIEGVLNEALSKLLGEEIKVTGASRTDSGVHSLGNVAIFDTETRIPPEKIMYAVNQRLPEDIVVQESCQVASDWHPRHCDSRKTYEYRILNRAVPLPTRRLDTYFLYQKLDLEKMQRAADYLEGTHDFKSFCSSGSPVQDTVRTIYSCRMEKTGDVITISVTGSGFLYNMVRIIAGTLLQAGMGIIAPEDVPDILAAKDRRAAGPTAPANGLTMMGISYEDALWEPVMEECDFWSFQLIRGEIPQKRIAYVLIKRCEDASFSGCLEKIIRRAKGYGAEHVYICDREKDGRLRDGVQCGEWLLRHAHDILPMKKAVKTDGSSQEQLFPVWKPVQREELAEYRDMVNEIFQEVPNSATQTLQEMEEFLEKESVSLFWLLDQEEKAGFLVLTEQEGELEVEEIGLLKACRGRGLAERALRKAEELAVQKGIQMMSLTVASSNFSAKGLYEKIGYHAEGILSQWYTPNCG